MKRKYLFLVVLGCCLLLLTGCGTDSNKNLTEGNSGAESSTKGNSGNDSSNEESKEQVMICHNSSSQTSSQNNVKLDLTYTVYYVDDYVTRVKSVEEVESDDTDLLEAYQDQVEKIYEPYKNVRYYDYEVVISGKRLTSRVDIDYEHIDTDKLIDIDSSNATLIKDGKVAIDDIENLYAHPFQKQTGKKQLITIKDREIPIYLFTPKTRKQEKVILFYHGGGFVSGSISSYNGFCQALADALDQLVIVTDYRLAPEFPFPNGLQDCYEVTEYLYTYLKKQGKKEEDITLMGYSAGGNFTAVISLMARDQKAFSVYQQVLLYPLLETRHDNALLFPSFFTNGNDYLLTDKQVDDYLHLYLSKEEDWDQDYTAPLRADLSNQPRTLIVTAQYDPLRDDGKNYTKKMKKYGNEVDYFEVPEELHGFLLRNSSRKNIQLVLEKINLFINRK